jgi:hypothetical protein
LKLHPSSHLRFTLPTLALEDQALDLIVTDLPQLVIHPKHETTARTYRHPRVHSILPVYGIFGRSTHTTTIYISLNKLTDAHPRNIDRTIYSRYLVPPYFPAQLADEPDERLPEDVYTSTFHKSD